MRKMEPILHFIFFRFSVTTNNRLNGLNPVFNIIFSKFNKNSSICYTGSKWCLQNKTKEKYIFSNVNKPVIRHQL